MAYGHKVDTWDHTSQVLAAIINSAPFRKKRKPILPHQLNPYAKRAEKRRLSREESIALLHRAFGTG